MIVVACDPGKTGAVVAVSQTDLDRYYIRAVFSLVGGDDLGTFGYDFNSILFVYQYVSENDCQCIIELPQTRFKNSASSSQVAGIGYAFAYCSLTAKGLPVAVQAQTWKRALGLTGPGGSKEAKRRSIAAYKQKCINANGIQIKKPVSLDGLADAFNLGVYLLTKKGD